MSQDLTGADTQSEWDIADIHEHPATHGIAWFVLITILSYVVSGVDPGSAVLSGFVSSIFYTAIVHFWEPYS
jgi:hypothetical protein